MKKICLSILLIFVLLSMTACEKAYVGHDGLIEKAREEIPLADIEHMEIMIAGSVDVDDSSLIWFITGNEYQKHSYFPMEFQISPQDSSKFYFVKDYEAYERGQDIVAYPWNGYVFLVNNPECKKLVLNGTEEIEITGKLPFIYHTSIAPESYQFFDTLGNEIY